MANLLDEASILLTATAYDNGSMLAVKPENGDGDFTFSRNSAATRVNAQGLVENVQILSSNLVSNGDFSQEGSQLITNGDFATDSDWVKGTGWTISGGTANCDGTNFATISQSKILVVGKTYKYSFTISNLTQGGVRLFLGNTVGSTNSANGTFTGYITYSSGSSIFLQARDSFIGSITNISVKEVGQDWTLGTGWSIGDGVAIQSGGVGQLSQNIGIALGTVCRVTFTTTISVGAIKIALGPSGPTTTFTSSGTHTFEGAFGGNSLIYILGSSASFVGSITNISVIEITNDTNLPRINYEGFSYDANGDIIPNSGCGSWLMEGQSTNLIPYSEDFSNWSKENVTNASNVTTSPDGTQNADTIIDGGTNTRHINYESFSGNLATERTLSVYAKQNNLRYLFLSVTNSGDSNCYSAIFDLQSGIISATKINGTATNSASMISMGDGWYRCIISGTVTTATATASYFSMIGTSDRSGFTGSLQNNNAPIYTGSGQSIYIYGAMLEQQSYPTSYIPTQGASSTRLADISNNSGNASLINSEEGTFYAEISALSDDGTYRNIALSDGSLTNRILLQYTPNANQINIVIVFSGGQYSLNHTVSNVTEFNKIAIKYKAGDNALWINGLEVDTDTNTLLPSSLNTLSFDNTIGDTLYSKTKALAVYKTALTDLELESITSWASFTEMAKTLNYTIK
tara:strand:- start:1419 stop:3485 length:2067 start_codon:yes stop_codon:yes gene_type:complete